MGEISEQTKRELHQTGVAVTHKPKGKEKKKSERRGREEDLYEGEEGAA